LLAHTLTGSIIVLTIRTLARLNIESPVIVESRQPE